MSRKIIGVTVGSSLPKPNFKQTDPTKGDYIRNKPDFDGLQNKVNTVSDLIGDTPVSEQINKSMENVASIYETKTDATEKFTDLESRVATNTENIAAFVEVSEEEINALFA